MAAANLLVTKGYSAASTNKIAKKAGVSIGSIYQYFSGKDGIFESIVEYEMRDTVSSLSKFPVNKNLTTEENLEAFITSGNQSDILSGGVYVELARHRQFRHILNSFALAVQVEIAAYLRRLEIGVQEERIMEMAQMIQLTAQGLARGSGEDGAVPEKLVKEYVTMVSQYVLNG